MVMWLMPAKEDHTHNADRTYGGLVVPGVFQHPTTTVYDTNRTAPPSGREHTLRWSMVLEPCGLMPSAMGCARWHSASQRPHTGHTRAVYNIDCVSWRRLRRSSGRSSSFPDFRSRLLLAHSHNSIRVSAARQCCVCCRTR